MTWAYVPSTTSAFVPAEEGLTQPSNLLCQTLAQSFFWRGKRTPSIDWSRRLKKVAWLTRLSGRMPQLSAAERGVESWIASLGAHPASPIPWPESAKAPMTSETSGATLGASSSRHARGSCGLRMCPACSVRSPASFRERSESAETYTAWVTRLRADSSARKVWASAMSANASSSSPSGGSARPTPQNRDHKGANQEEMIDWGNARPLNETAVIWERNRSGSTWSTPRASDGEKGGPNQTFGTGGVPLPAQAAKWTTPLADDTSQRTKKFAQGGTPLSMQAAEASAKWCTPSVAISTGGQSSRSGDRKGEELLTGQARSLFSHLDQMTTTPGSEPSPSDPTLPPLSLNPVFVSWLMGWIVLASTNSGYSEMGSRHFKAAMRSELLRIGLPPEAPRAQPSLF